VAYPGPLNTTAQYLYQEKLVANALNVADFLDPALQAEWTKLALYEPDKISLVPPK